MLNAHVIWLLRLRPPYVICLFMSRRWSFTAIRRVETMQVANGVI